MKREITIKHRYFSKMIIQMRMRNYLTNLKNNNKWLKFKNLLMNYLRKVKREPSDMKNYFKEEMLNNED